MSNYASSSVINKLWDEMQDAIASAYTIENERSKAPGDGHSIAGALRDYVRNMSHHDQLRELLETETAHERHHRRAAPAEIGFTISAVVASKLLIMGNVADGSKLETMPAATIFITCRDSAAESMLLGYMIRETLPQSWIAGVKALDYTKIGRKVS